MPIRPEFRQFYGRAWREVTRPQILARAGNKCEQCGAPNHRRVWRRLLNGRTWWSRYMTVWRNCEGLVIPPPRNAGPAYRVRIILTIAHLNHTPGEDGDENLKALCQWCHLNYDKLHHRESRASRKDASRPLLQQEAAC